MSHFTSCNEKRIGSGTYGVVRSADLIEPTGFVKAALKSTVLKKEHSFRFLNTYLRKEHRVLSELKGVPGVVRVFGYQRSELEDQPETLVLQLAEHGSLGRLLRNTAVSEITAKYLFSHLAFTLDQIHARGVAHLSLIHI